MFNLRVVAVVMTTNLFISSIVSIVTSNLSITETNIDTTKAAIVNQYTFGQHLKQNEKINTNEILEEKELYSTSQSKETNKDKLSETTTNNIESTKMENPVQDEATVDQGLIEENRLTISFAGDCTIGWDETFSYQYSFPYQLKEVKNNYAYFFYNVKHLFESDDLTLVNLETTFTKGKKKANKKFRFKGDPSYVNILKDGSVEMVNISNNHIYDYLEEGFDETINTLKEENILYSGEGHIAYHTIRGVTIASLGYKGWSTSIKKNLSEDIKIAKENADIIIVSFHWGQERSYYPNNTQIELGRFVIDQGADVVVGHHPHVIQGIEKYNGKYIIYSLGNFVFGGNKNPSDKDSFIFQTNFLIKDKEITKTEGSIIPCRISSESHINNYQPIIVEEEEKERILDRIYSYSSKLKYGISKDTSN